MCFVALKFDGEGGQEGVRVKQIVYGQSLKECGNMSK